MSGNSDCVIEKWQFCGNLYDIGYQTWRVGSQAIGLCILFCNSLNHAKLQVLQVVIKILLLLFIHTKLVSWSGDIDSAPIIFPREITGSWSGDEDSALVLRLNHIDW